jgi:hypothetical protein
MTKVEISGVGNGLMVSQTSIKAPLRGARGNSENGYSRGITMNIFRKTPRVWGTSLFHPEILNTFGFVNPYPKANPITCDLPLALPPPCSELD